MLQQDSLKTTALTNSLVVENTPVYKRVSLFQNHELKPVHTSPILTNVPVFYWPSILLFIVFGLYISVRITSPKTIFKICIAVFNPQLAKQLMREDYKLTKRVSLFLSACFVLVFAFLLYKTSKHFDLLFLSYSDLLQYCFFVVLIIIVYATKIFTNSLFSSLTKNTELGQEYIFNVFLFAQVMGVFLFPLVAFIQFSRLPIEWFLYPSLAICFMFYALRSLRGFVLAGLEQNSGFLHIILYFCALEILPMLVLVEFLVNHF